MGGHVISCYFDARCGREASPHLTCLLSPFGNLSGDLKTNMRERAPEGAAKRLREIFNVAIREGLYVPIARLRLSHCASLRCRLHCTWQRWTGQRPSDLPWPVAVKDTLIRLGPTFVKIGQILSVRSDLVPAELGLALHGLQSNVPPEAPAAIRELLEADLGKRIEEAFESFDPTPLAAGSVAQVHRARWPGGHDVVVKIKRPGIDARVEEDLGILVWLASILERRSAEARKYRPKTIARELRRYTLRELDFRNEADVARQIRSAFLGSDEVIIPEVFFATRNVIVMEYVDSVPIDDLASLAAAKIDPAAVLRIGIRSLLKQIFELGLFHGDPHPGNLHVTPEGKLVYLDFGIFGHLDERLRRIGALLVLTLVRGDVDMMAYFLFRVAHLEPGADARGYKAAVEERYQEWRGSTIGEYGFGRLVFELLSLGARHGLSFPADLVLYSKAMVTIEGVARTLAPDLNLADELKPYLEDLQGQLFSLKQLAQAAERSAPLWWDLAQRLPVELAKLVDHTVRTADHFEPESAAKAAVAAPVLGRSILAAATALMGAILAASQVPPLVANISLPGAVIGLVGLAAMAMIWRRSPFR